MAEEIKQPAAPMHRQTDERLSLSAEEQIIIKKLQDEAFFYRGLPLALSTGIMCSFMLRRKFPQMTGIRSFGLSMVAAVSGNLVGKVTYAPEMIRRLEKELPDDSELKRQILARRSGTGGSELMPGTIDNPFGNTTTAPAPTNDVGFNEVPAASNDQQSEIMALEDSKYVTYDDLRKKHRQSLDWRQPRAEESAAPAVVDDSLPSATEDEFPSRLARPRTPPVRYNKYGDPILD